MLKARALKTLPLASSLLSVSPSTSREVHTSSRRCWDEYDNKIFIDQGEELWRRTQYALQFDFKRYKRRYDDAKWDAYKRKPYGKVVNTPQRYELIPFNSDFLIIGGGITGSSVAYWLKQRIRDEDLLITVIENDDSLEKSSTVLSLGNIRTQFAAPENVAMSLFTAEFLRNAGEHLRINDSEPPDINFIPMGHMFLATTPEAAEYMEEDWKMQGEMGAKVDMLNKDQLQQRFPFIRFDDVIAGTIGLENEGAVDPWQLLSAIREKNIANGVQYIKGTVDKFMYEDDPFKCDGTPFKNYKNLYDHKQLTGVVLRTQKSDSAPRPIRFHKVINCAGAWSGDIAGLSGIGHGPEMLAFPIPVEPRKRFVFVVHCPDGPGLLMPHLVDPTGVWARRVGEGDLYYVGKNPSAEEDAGAIDHSNLTVDYDFFYNRIWPILAARVPAFKNLKIKNAWAGYHDVNYWDGQPIIGYHQAWYNMFHVCGLGGNGIQHSMGIGRAVMEQHMDGAYRDINLRKYGPNRLLNRRKLPKEKATMWA